MREVFGDNFIVHEVRQWILTVNFPDSVPGNLRSWGYGEQGGIVAGSFFSRGFYLANYCPQTDPSKPLGMFVILR